jgi:hypothetical protein
LSQGAIARREKPIDLPHGGLRLPILLNLSFQPQHLGPLQACSAASTLIYVLMVLGLIGALVALSLFWDHQATQGQLALSRESSRSLAPQTLGPLHLTAMLFTSLTSGRCSSTLGGDPAQLKWFGLSADIVFMGILLIASLTSGAKEGLDWD